MFPLDRCEFWPSLITTIICQGIYTEQSKSTFSNFFINQHQDAGKLPPLQGVLLISSTLIVYTIDHIGTARHGLRNHKIDTEWHICTFVF